MTQGLSTNHQSSGGRELSGFLRPPRLDFLKFDGNDPTGWLCRTERYFTIHQITTDQKVPIAALHLEHEAAQWYQWLEKTHGDLPWVEFRAQLLT
eukprot:Gb_07714 [translate_table: standard]